MKYSLLLFCYFFLSSCITPITLYKTNYNPIYSKMDAKFIVKTQTISTFLFGFIHTGYTMKLHKKCYANWHSIKITKPFFYIITSFITFGFYTPLKVIIWCDPDKSSTKNTTDILNKDKNLDLDLYLDDDEDINEPEDEDEYIKEDTNTDIFHIDKNDAKNIINNKNTIDPLPNKVAPVFKINEEDTINYEENSIDNKNTINNEDTINNKNIISAEDPRYQIPVFEDTINNEDIKNDENTISNEDPRYQIPVFEDTINNEEDAIDNKNTINNENTINPLPNVAPAFKNDEDVISDIKTIDNDDIIIDENTINDEDSINNKNIISDKNTIDNDDIISDENTIDNKNNKL